MTARPTVAWRNVLELLAVNLHAMGADIDSIVTTISVDYEIYKSLERVFQIGPADRTEWGGFVIQTDFGRIQITAPGL